MSHGDDGETFVANALASKEVVNRRFRLTIYANSMLAARASGELKFQSAARARRVREPCAIRIAT